MKTYCVILASGTGTRFGGDRPKQFVRINGRMILEYTLDACIRADVVDEIVLVVSEQWRDSIEPVAASFRRIKPVRIVIGGLTRRESCEKGVASILDVEAKILIHNGVQPFITAKTLTECDKALDSYSAVSVGSPCVYTVLELDEKRELQRILRRDRSVNDLGPECFKLSFLRNVFDTVEPEDTFTNITGLVMKNRLASVFIVDGDPSNTKITYPDDLLLAERKFAAYRFMEVCHG